MTGIRTWIVDDEPLARERVRTLLVGDPEIQVAGESANGADAARDLVLHRPELLFLDIQMPELDGFELLRSLTPDATPTVVFVTAYDQYALRAFEVHAIDYLLKPYDRERFERALARAKATVRARRATEIDRRLEALLSEVRREPRRIAVQVDGNVLLLRHEEIDWIEASGNYVKLHLGKRSLLHREPLKDFEARLDPARFLRIHRSMLVNLDRIRQLQPWFNGGLMVILEDGTELQASRSAAERLRERFASPPRIGD